MTWQALACRIFATHWYADMPAVIARAQEFIRLLDAEAAINEAGFEALVAWGKDKTRPEDPHAAREFDKTAIAIVNAAKDRERQRRAEVVD